MLSYTIPESAQPFEATIAAARAEHPEGIPLLIHACCGPCSLEPIRQLIDEGFAPTICWTNPNIQPASEHARRLETITAWARDVVKLPLIVAPDTQELWERAVPRHGFEKEARCRSCYAVRLGEAARIATENNFAFMSTTLAVSPHQLFDVCTDVLIKVATSRGLTPVVRDWRALYAQAQVEAEELGLYRQNYCGCRFSAAEATLERQAQRSAS